MAILDSQPQIEVRVFVQGQPATEYRDNDSEHAPPPAANHEPPHLPDNKVTKYVEAVSDATFDVHFNIFEGYRWTSTCLAFGVSTDGNRVSGVPLANPGHGLEKSGSIDGWRKISPAGDYSLLRFKFASFTTSEGDHAEKVEADKKLVEKLGTIEVQVHRGNLNGILGPLNQAPPSAIRTPLAEKALKGRALSHSTSSSDPEPSDDHRPDHSFNYIDGFNSPSRDISSDTDQEVSDVDGQLDCTIPSFLILGKGVVTLSQQELTAYRCASGACPYTSTFGRTSRSARAEEKW